MTEVAPCATVLDMKEIQSYRLPCQEDPDMWFSDSSSDKNLAINICNSCFFNEECKILGLSEVHGIWGGIDTTKKIPPLEDEVKLCRNKLHLKLDKGTCQECRKISRSSYYKKNYNKIIQRKTPWTRPRKHIKGGYCVNEHLLSDDNIVIRSNDKAILCKKCISWSKKTSNVYSKVGDFNA